MPFLFSYSLNVSGKPKPGKERKFELKLEWKMGQIAFERKEVGEGEMYTLKRYEAMAPKTMNKEWTRHMFLQSEMHKCHILAVTCFQPEQRTLQEARD